MTVINEPAELFQILHEPIRLIKEHKLAMFIATCTLAPLVEKAKRELAIIQQWKEQVENAFYS